MKKTISYLSIFVIAMTYLCVSCTKKGPQGEQGVQGEPGLNAQLAEPDIFGQWEVSEGTFGLENSKYVFINEDNTINILSEDAMGFKSDYHTNVMINSNQLIMSGVYYGTTIDNYSIDNNVLTISNSQSTTPIILQRIDNGPEASEWIKTLNVVTDGPAQWDRDIDIAFDGEYLLGFDSNESSILQVDPENFSVVGSIPTIHSAYALEIENSADPSRQLFQSNNGFSYFNSYIYSSNNPYYTSESLGSWIRGIASVEPGLLWISSSNEKSLYRYKSNGSLSPGEILETISLDFSPKGLDYRNGYLYLANGQYLYKCRTTPELLVVDTYKVENYNIDGVTYDGNNFWLSVTEPSNYTRRLVKTNLTI